MFVHVHLYNYLELHCTCIVHPLHEDFHLDSQIAAVWQVDPVVVDSYCVCSPGGVLRDTPVLPLSSLIVPGGMEHHCRREGYQPAGTMAAQHTGTASDSARGVIMQSAHHNNYPMCTCTARVKCLVCQFVCLDVCPLFLPVCASRASLRTEDTLDR